MHGLADDGHASLHHIQLASKTCPHHAFSLTVRAALQLLPTSSSANFPDGPHGNDGQLCLWLGLRIDAGNGRGGTVLLASPDKPTCGRGSRRRHLPMGWNEFARDRVSQRVLSEQWNLSVRDDSQRS